MAATRGALNDTYTFLAVESGQKKWVRGGGLVVWGAGEEEQRRRKQGKNETGVGKGRDFFSPVVGERREGRGSQRTTCGLRSLDSEVAQKLWVMGNLSGLSRFASVAAGAAVAAVAMATTNQSLRQRGSEESVPNLRGPDELLWRISHQAERCHSLTR